MYTTVVYDLDGTLIDSAVTVTQLLNVLRTEQGLSPLGIPDYLPWLSIGGEAMVAAALEISKEEAQPFLTIFRSRYLAEPVDPTIVFPGVHATLRQLQTTGTKLGICTNKPRQLTEKILAATGLDHFFTAICAGNDLTTSKPHPANLDHCLAQLGSLAAETLLVGDSRIDQQLATACGAHFAFFAAGYDDGVHIHPDTITIDRHQDILPLFPPFQGRSHRE